MTYELTQILVEPQKVMFPFTFIECIKGQGYKIKITLPTTSAEIAQLASLANTNNPAQVAAALASGTP